LPVLLPGIALNRERLASEGRANPHYGALNVDGASAS
jgi:hypothetical protein